MKVAIYGRNYNPGFRKFILEFFENLTAKSISVSIYKPFFDFLLNDIGYTPFEAEFFSNPEDAPSDVDFLISIGGDGTFLESLIYLKNFNIPVIGLNSGRLGYLANISENEITEAIEAIFQGNFDLEERSMLCLESENGAFGKFNFALNEISVQKKDSTMITVDTFINNEYLNTYWTDGLIVSTPTGSTAYNLSVGGPIVLPGTNNFVIAPIAPHNLTVRPLVLPDSAEIRLEVKSRAGNFMVTLDHRTEIMDIKQNTFYLRRSPQNLKLVKLPFNSYFATLRNKLMWGVDKRN